jgi:hypothetical protein
MLSGKSEVSTYRNEVNIETLIASSVFAQAFALQVFKVDPPAMLLRRVGRKIVHRTWGAVANARDIVPNLSRKNSDVLWIPRVVVTDRAALGNRRKLSAQQKAKSQEQYSRRHFRSSRKR